MYVCSVVKTCSKESPLVFAPEMQTFANGLRESICGDNGLEEIDDTVRADALLQTQITYLG